MVNTSYSFKDDISNKTLNNIVFYPFEGNRNSKFRKTSYASKQNGKQKYGYQKCVQNLHILHVETVKCS